MDVVEARDGLAVESEDDVAFADSCSRSRYADDPADAVDEGPPELPGLSDTWV